MNSAIRLLLSDVDGTLVTSSKVLTPRARRAAHELRKAGIELAITTGRPPRGVRMLIEPLALTTPIAAFNGALIVDAELRPLRSWSLPAEVASAVLQLFQQRGLDAWVYSDTEWFVRNPQTPRAQVEAQTVQFAPRVVVDFDEVVGRSIKLVGTSEDHQAVLACEQEVRRRFGDQVSTGRSQPYYLDVTHPAAHKGTAVKQLAELLQIPPESMATLGDRPTDVMMFAVSGLSIAMGNASSEVQRCARFVTTSNDEEGFANAIEQYLIGQRAGPTPLA